ncbi:MAG: hypothetical protein R2747_03135 [Pyrinomonadaceae bacterium]
MFPFPFGEHERIFIKLVTSEDVNLTLADVSSFLYDFSNLYSYIRLATDRNYSNFEFSDGVYFRNGKPLDNRDLLYVEKIRLESPLELVASIILATGGAITAVWSLVQIIEKIYNIPLNREKLKLDTEKARLEIAKLKRESYFPEEQPLLISPEESIDILRRREALEYVENVEQRFLDSPIKIRELNVYSKRIRK